MKPQQTIASRIVASLILGLAAAGAYGGAANPSALSASADDIAIPGGATHPISVVWSANDGPIDLVSESIDTGDIVVTGPGGNLTILSVLLDPPGDAPIITATYTVEAPSGVWDAGDNGLYVVDTVAGQIGTTNGSGVFNIAQPGITSFTVNVVPEPASMALLVLGGAPFAVRRRLRVSEGASK